jgi:hypothetical protein
LSEKSPKGPKGEDTSFRAPREFQPVESVAEGLKLLKEGCKTLSSAMIWTKDQEQVLNSHLSVFSDSTDSFYCWAPKDFDSKKFVADVQASAHSECFFSVSLFRANIFFRASFVALDTAGLLFKFPTKIFKVQRRNDVRLPLLDFLAVKVHFRDPLFPDKESIRKVLDISAGGMAFLIHEEDVPLYPVGLTLNDFLFKVANRTFKIRAQISNSRKLRDEKHKGAFAVGVQFLDLRPGDVQHIASWVFEESRKYFTRFI